MLDQAALLDILDAPTQSRGRVGVAEDVKGLNDAFVQVPRHDGENRLPVAGHADSALGRLRKTLRQGEKLLPRGSDRQSSHTSLRLYIKPYTEMLTAATAFGGAWECSIHGNSTGTIDHGATSGLAQFLEHWAGRCVSDPAQWPTRVLMSQPPGCKLKSKHARMLSEGLENGSYWARITKQRGGGYLVEFSDLPGCVTEGRTAREALANAREALSGWLFVAIKHGDGIPSGRARRARGYHRVVPDLDVSIPLAILCARKRRGLTQAAVARALGVSQQAYRKFETPGKSNPTLKTLERLSGVLGLALSLRAA